MSHYQKHVIDAHANIISEISDLKMSNPKIVILHTPEMVKHWQREEPLPKDCPLREFIDATQNYREETQISDKQSTK